MPDATPAPHSTPDPEKAEAASHRNALAASLRARFLQADAAGDAAAKQALFEEAAYLNLPPDLLGRDKAEDKPEGLSSAQD